MNWHNLRMHYIRRLPLLILLLTVFGAAAWLLLMVTFLGLTITISASGERLPDWLYAVFLAALAAVVWLDFVAIAPLGDIGRNATASVSASKRLVTKSSRMAAMAR